MKQQCCCTLYANASSYIIYVPKANYRFALYGVCCAPWVHSDASLLIVTSHLISQLTKNPTLFKVTLKEWATKVAKSAFFHSIQFKCQHLPSQLSVCGATCPLCFQFGKHAYSHFGPQCSCQCKSGRTLRPIDTDVRKDSVSVHPLGLINDKSLLLQRVSRRVGELPWIANVKLLTRVPCKLQENIIAPLGICAKWTNRILLHDECSLKMHI